MTKTNREWARIMFSPLVRYPRFASILYLLLRKKSHVRQVGEMVVLCPQGRAETLSSCVDYAVGKREIKSSSGNSERRINVNDLSLTKYTVNLKRRLFASFPEDLFEKLVNYDHGNDQTPSGFYGFNEVMRSRGAG